MLSVARRLFSFPLVGLLSLSFQLSLLSCIASDCLFTFSYTLALLCFFRIKLEDFPTLDSLEWKSSKLLLLKSLARHQLLTNHFIGELLSSFTYHRLPSVSFHLFENGSHQISISLEERAPERKMTDNKLAHF